MSTTVKIPEVALVNSPIDVQGATIKRSEIWLDPYNAASFGQGAGGSINTIKFTFPNPGDHVADVRNARLQFRASVTGTGRFCNNIENIVDGIKLYTATTELVNVQDLGPLNQIYFHTITTTVDDNIFTALRGVGSTVDRDGWAGGRKYETRPLYIFFRDALFLPLFAMNEPLQLELSLAAFSEILEVATATGYTISDVRLSIPVYQVTPEYKAYIMKTIADGQWQTRMQNIYNNQAIIPAGISNNSLQVSLQRSSLTEAFFVMRTLADTTALGVNDKLDTFNYNNAQSVRLLLNGTDYLPAPGPLDVTSVGGAAPDPFYQLLALATSHDNFYTRDFGRITMPQYITNKFIVGFNLRSWPSSLAQDYVSGYKSSLDTNNIRLQILLGSGSPASAQVVDQYWLSDQVMQITPAGKIVIKQANF